MAFNFTREDAVLNFGPRRPREHTKRTSWEYILWPAWSYRVVAPRVRDRQLNMFQRAVLGLCKAGQQDFTSIGQRLSIHPDLAAFILVELCDLGYVDGDGLATDQGLRVLEDDAHDVHDMVAGYVFQDPWTGDLWPRFVEQLDYCDLEFDESGFPKLLLGTTGKPWRQGAFMVLPNGAPTPTQPSPAKVVSAVAGHRKGMRYADDLSEWEDDLGQPGYSPSTVHIDRVSFIEEEPTPVFLMTYLYLTESSSSAGDWHACDPFGLGASVRLRRRVEQVMQEEPNLYNVVNRLVGRVLHDGLEEQRRWVEQLRTMAAIEVEGRLGVNIRTHPAFEQILSMEFARQETSLLGRDCPESKLQAALRECVKVLEMLLAEIGQRYSLINAIERVRVTKIDRRTGRRSVGLQQDKRWLQALFNAAAKDIGFLVPLPKAMLFATAGKIQAAAQPGGHWQLRPLLVATLLAVDSHRDHPFRRAARIAPDLLDKIDTIATKGGGAGHADSATTTLHDVNATVDLTYTVISILSGLGADAEVDPEEGIGAAHVKA